MTTYTINSELNGIEITFSSKPEADTLTALKTNGFRWHRVKRLWYAKNTAERLSLAKSLAELTDTLAAITDKIDLEGLGANRPSLYGAELAAAIREDLKKRGVKGATVRSRRVTHDTGITVTIKATAADIVSMEEYSLRYTFDRFACDAMGHGVYSGEGYKWIYSADWESMTEEERRAAYRAHAEYDLVKSPDFGRYNQERKHYPTMTTDFFNKVLAIFKIANQWNYNNSDPMTDYFDIGYYLDIDIKTPADLVIRENMTEEERRAYEEEKRQEEEERAAALAKYEQEQEETRKAHEAYEKKRKADREIIENNIIVEDLSEADQIYITDLVGGYGKENNLEELNKAIEERADKRDALITRKVIFKTREAYETFTNYLLDDFDFLDHMGGTASEDVRLEEVKALYNLNAEQREDVKWFMNKCVAFYCNGVLELVSNPEGYSYSRYTYRLSDEGEITSAQAETEKQRNESEKKTPFYFPAPVKEQADALKEGQKITVYQCDGWMLNSVYGGYGIITGIRDGQYAQYTGVYIELLNGKKATEVFIRDDHECLIYEGIKPLLPKSVTERKISDNMSLLLNYDELFPNILKYYEGMGEKPIIDTIQR